MRRSRSNCKVVCAGRNRSIKMDVCFDSRHRIKSAKKIGRC